MDIVFMVKFSVKRPFLVSTVMNLLRPGKRKISCLVVCLEIPWLPSL
jgi:hypothetical protein